MHQARTRYAALSIFTLLLVTSGSCLRDMPETIPEHFTWDPELAFPLGSGQFGIDAAEGYKDEWLELDTITDIPNWIDTVVTLEYRMDFDLSSLNESTDDINRVLMRINISNGFPNEILAQGYFTDSLHNQYDSLFSNGPLLLNPGNPSGDGETVTPSLTRPPDVVFDREGVARLEPATELLFRGTFTNLSDIDPGLYPHYPSYEMGLEVGVMLDLTIAY